MKVYYRLFYAFIWSIFILPGIAQNTAIEYETRSVVKKQLNASAPTVEQFQSLNPKTAENKTEKIIDLHNSIGRSSDNYEIPNSFRVGFYIFIGLGLLAIFYIIFRSYRLRLSRAERRYGVQGDRSAQELTPLPIAIEEDSDTEDQTVFEINRQERVS